MEWLKLKILTSHCWGGCRSLGPKPTAGMSVKCYNHCRKWSEILLINVNIDLPISSPDICLREMDRGTHRKTCTKLLITVSMAPNWKQPRGLRTARDLRAPVTREWFTWLGEPEPLCFKNSRSPSGAVAVPTFLRYWFLEALVLDPSELASASSISILFVTTLGHLCCELHFPSITF